MDPFGYAALSNVIDLASLIVGYYVVVITMVLVFFAYMRCLFSPQNLGSCVVAFLGAFLLPVVGFGENMLELGLSAWETFHLWQAGDFDDFGFGLVLFALAMGAMLSVGIGIAISEVKIGGKKLPNTAIGIASIGVANLIASLIDLAKDANLEASRRRAF